jgi:type IV secretion system protein VirB5
MKRSTPPANQSSGIKQCCAVLASCLAIYSTPIPVSAQGIPVIDVTAIMQAIEQVRAWEQQYQQMQQQLMQQQQMLQNTTGTRNLGMAANNITQPILPPDIGQQIAATPDHQSLNRLAVSQFGHLNQALQTRSTQIQQLMQQINATNDAKSIQELTARIQAEQVMASNEAKEAEWLRSQVALQAQHIDLTHRARMLNPQQK